MFLYLKKTAWIFVLLLLLLPAGCKPEGIIPRNDMVSLFCEFYLADASINVERATGESLRGVDSLRVYLPIIQQHGYSKDEFRTSLEYYMHRPDDMEEIFKRVHTNLEQETKRLAEDEAGMSNRRIHMDVEEVEEPEPEERPAVVKEVKERKPKKEVIADKEDKEKVEEKVEEEKKPLRRKMTKKELKQLEEGLK